MKHKLNWWMIGSIPVILSFITFLIYYPSLWYGFIFDDLPTITNYIHIRSLDFAGQFFKNPRWISRLLNQFTYTNWGPTPFPFRIVNLMMHLFSGTMIFFIVYRLFDRCKKTAFLSIHALPLASLTTLLFLLHPVQTQTVTYITQMRLEGLVVFFSSLVLLTFSYAATVSVPWMKIWLYIISFGAMAFAAGTKEVIVVLPILVLATDWFFIAEGDISSLKSRLWVHGSYGAILWGLLLKYGYLTPRFISTIAATPLHNNRGNILTSSAQLDITLFQWIISQFKVLLHYTRIFFWPVDICFDYDMKLAEHWYSPDVLLPLTVLLSFGCLCLWLLKQNKAHPLVYGFIWFFGFVLPRASIFPSTELVCDYKTYPAAFGIMLALALMIWWALLQLKSAWPLMQRLFKLRHATTLALGFLCIGLAYATSARNFVWSSELEFWKDVVKKAPKARCYNNLGTGYWEKGQTKEAIEAFHHAIEKDNWYGEPHVNLATIYQVSGNIDKALDHYRRAMEIGEGHPEMFNNLGILHFSQKAYDKAEICFKQAVALRPYYSKSYTSLGKIYVMQNKHEQALECYEKALVGDNPDQEAFYLHGSICFDLGRYEKAAKSLEVVNPNYMNTAFLTGSSYYHQKKYADAAKYFKLAHQFYPGDSICTYNLAQSLMNIGNYQEALPLYKVCMADEKAFPFACLHRVKCLFHAGMLDEAERSLSVVINQTKVEEVKLDAILLARELKLT